MHVYRNHNEYYSTYVKIPQFGVYSWSCDVLKFGEMSVNISETVHDRDIVTMEDQ